MGEGYLSDSMRAILGRIDVAGALVAGWRQNTLAMAFDRSEA